MEKQKTPNNKSYLKYNNIFIIMICIATLFMSVGYASINSTSLDIASELAVNSQDGAFITTADVKYNLSTNPDITNTKVNSAYQTMLNTEVGLSSTDPNSTVVMEITVHNGNSVPVMFNGVKTDGTSSTYSNENIIYTLSGLDEGYQLAAGDTVTFTITFSYKDKTLPADGNYLLESCLNFEFVEGYAIEIDSVEGGTLSSENSYVVSGNTVTLMSIASTGYYYAGAIMSYTDENGEIQTLSLDSDTLTFTMPGSNVVITPIWKELLSVKILNPGSPSDSLTVYYEEDMTWEDFVASEYNTTGFKITDDNYVESTLGTEPTVVSKIIYVTKDMLVGTKQEYYEKPLSGLLYFDIYDPVLTIDDPSNTTADSPVYSFELLYTIFGTVTDQDNDLSSVTVNGEEVTVNDDGTWSADVSLIEGINTITVIATDEAGNTSTEICYIYGGAVAQAIYSSDDSSLTFIFDKLYTVGETYNDKTVTDVYTGFENESYMSSDLVPWDSISNTITSVVVEDEIKPISTKYWFYEFKKCASFELSKFNTSNVTDMSYMFAYAGYNASSFDVDVSNWNTSNVTDMSYMFECAGWNVTTFNIDISDWNTSSVTNLSFMFSHVGVNATTFEIDLSSWDVSSVTNMQGMFSYTAVEDSIVTWSVGDLGNWNTSNVTNMSFMFSWLGYNATTIYLGDLGNWDVSSVTDMQYMFTYFGRKLAWSAGNIGNWDVSSVTNMSSMFSNAGYRATTFDIGDLSKWDTSSVTDMGYMFSNAGYRATTFDIGDLSKWDTSSVTDMGSMFSSAGYNATYKLDLSGWNVSNVTSYNKFNTNVTTKVIAPAFG